MNDLLHALHLRHVEKGLPDLMEQARMHSLTYDAFLRRFLTMEVEGRKLAAAHTRLKAAFQHTTSAPISRNFCNVTRIARNAGMPSGSRSTFMMTSAPARAASPATRSLTLNRRNSAAGVGRVASGERSLCQNGATGRPAVPSTGVTTPATMDSPPSRNPVLERPTCTGTSPVLVRSAQAITRPEVRESRVGNGSTSGI